MTRLGAIAMTAALLVSGAAVRAHHSFAATYVESQTKTLQGTLVQVMFRNPHSFVHLMVSDEHGQKQRWAVEWGAPPQLKLQGVVPTTLKVGDEVIIAGNPGRNPADHVLRMRSIKRPADGWEWNGTFH